MFHFIGAAIGALFGLGDNAPAAHDAGDDRYTGGPAYRPNPENTLTRDAWDTERADLPAWGAGARFNGNSRPAINWDAVDEFGIDCSKLGKERGINYDALVDDWRGRP